MELRMKNDEQQRQIHDIGTAKSRLQFDNGELCRQVEELEANINATTRLKVHLIMMDLNVHDFRPSTPPKPKNLSA